MNIIKTSTVMSDTRHGMTAYLMHYVLEDVFQPTGTEECYMALMNGPIDIVDKSEHLLGFMAEGECDRDKTTNLATFHYSMTDWDEALEDYRNLQQDLKDAF